MPFVKIFSTAAIVFILDRITKYWVVEWMNLRDVYAIDVFPPYLNLRMAWNDGINFGLFGSGGESTRWILITIALAISLVVVFWARNAKGWKAPVSAGLVVGGALGNVFDRFIYGAVADFLNMSCCGFRNPFSFNIADATIFLGLFGLILFLDDKKKS
ncbi:MAG: signal peptidase II [Rhodobacteraceae bacterium]|nr:signal peptidase II [Paracoccaceae bacterium]